MSALLHFVITLALCTVAAPWLARSRWLTRSPGIGVVTWQLLALTWVLCLVGGLLASGLLPYRASLPVALPAALGDVATGRAPAEFTAAHAGLFLAGVGAAAAAVGAVLLSWVAASRTRRRHRTLLALVARDCHLPDVLLLDHPMVTAYCVPGIRGQVVISSGALRVLTSAELNAVLAHERAHARERHDLAILPFSGLRRLAPRSGVLARVCDAVSLLLEMRADDVACRRHGVGPLAAALQRFRDLGSNPPASALGIGDASIDARLNRITRPGPVLGAPVRWLVLSTAAILVSTPISFFVLS